MKIKKNIVTQGFSGTLGNRIIFKTRGNKTFVSKYPAKKRGKPSATQQRNSQKFAEAVQYARQAIADPVLKQAYTEKLKDNQSAFNRAMVDFFRSPVILSADHNGYNGQPGSIIDIRAYDDFQLAGVRVDIFNAAGILLEQGNAVAGKDALSYRYITTILHEQIAGNRITITATDLPGNTTVMEIVIQ